MEERECADGLLCCRVPISSTRAQAVVQHDESEELRRHDLAVDFVSAKKALEAIAKELDYRYINEHPDFAGRNTSAENLARWFAERLTASVLFPSPGRLEVIRITFGQGDASCIAAAIERRASAYAVKGVADTH